MISFILLALCVLFSALASIFLKMGVASLVQPLSFLSLISNYKVWLGGTFYAVAFFGYIYVLRMLPLSLAQPVITAGGTAVTTVVAVLLFKEQLLLSNWFGLVLIVVGIGFLFLGRS
ncbi:MAG: hypothetical protein WCL60_12630 [Methylococcales bacterium]